MDFRLDQRVTSATRGAAGACAAWRSHLSGAGTGWLSSSSSSSSCAATPLLTALATLLRADDVAYLAMCSRYRALSGSVRTTAGSCIT